MMSKKNIINRKGTKLNDGHLAHSADHQNWSRRQFLSRSGVMASSASLISQIPLISWASPLMASLQSNTNNDKVIILIRLFGGNDGLNMIVPMGANSRRSRYETLRSNIKIKEQHLSNLQVGSSSSEFGLPMYEDATSHLLNMWNEGNMAVVHNVGYENQNRSHFVGSDLWASGAENNSSVLDERRYNGWLGRYLDDTLPAFLQTPPVIPPAIQIGVSNNLIFKGKHGVPFDLVFPDLNAFDNVVNTGELFNTNSFIDSSCISDIERVFVRQVGNSTLRYAEAVKCAYLRSETDTTVYGSNNLDGFTARLETVSRLIKGRLGTKIYLVGLGSFDTHNAQVENNSGTGAGTHVDLLKDLSIAVGKIHQDLKNSGDADRVMMMTFSEFGRTVSQNSYGTDHGTLAPIMLFGNAVNGKNFYGTPIDLTADKIGNHGSVHFDTQEGAIDFRSVYDKILRDWLCADVELTDEVLNYQVDHNPMPTSKPGPYKPCTDSDNSDNIDYCDDPLGGMISGACNSSYAQASSKTTYIPSEVLLGFNVIENGNDRLVEIRYAIRSEGNVKLKILDFSGGTVDILVDSYQQANSYLHTYDASQLLKDSPYTCCLEVNGMRVERTLEIH